MARKKQVEPALPESDVFTEQAALRQQEAAAQVQQVADAHAMAPEHATPHANGKSHAAGVERKKYTVPADPFGFETHRAGSNRVRLLKSEGGGAWVIRFAHNPNQDKGPNGETYGKENPHPVLKMLKEEGYRWGFDGGDGDGGWGKAFSGDPYGQDHIEARRVLGQALDLIGGHQRSAAIT